MRPLHTERGDEGYLLVGLTVMVFLILLAASVAAPLIAKDMERTREVEAARRGMQYQRAIQLFYRRTGRYPGSIDQLDETSNQHFLRRHYVDPLTGGDYRLIALGEQQTKPKGFFGKPLDGLDGGGMGSGLGGGIGSGIGSPGLGSSTPPTGATSATGATGTTTSRTSGSPGSTGGLGSGIGGTNATDFKGGKGAIVAVGTDKKGKAIVAVNGEDDFEKWEFLYDPRMDQMRAKASLLGGGMSEGGAGAMGSGINGSSTPGNSLSSPSPSGFGGPTSSGSSSGSGTSTPKQ